MVCNRVRRVVFLWIDRDREVLPREAIARHLEGCPHCRSRAVEIETVLTLVRVGCGRSAAPSQLADRIRALVAGSGVGEPGDPR